MSLLNTVPADKAEGNVKEIYGMFEQMGVEVPMPLQMLSASPDLLALQGHYINWVMNHPALSPSLRTHIRLMTAHEESYTYCIDFNKNILKSAMGLSDDQIAAVGKDVSEAALKPEEIALLKFVQKVLRDPAQTLQDDMDRLKSMGWQEADILDATLMAMNMLAMGMMFKAFKMGDA